MCAAVKRQLGDSLEIFRQNLHIVENVCEILQKRPIRKVVYFSSAAVYGEDIHNLTITEETPVQPRSFYGVAKYASERLLWKVMSSSKTSSLAVLRPPLVYGVGDESEGYGPAGFLARLFRNEEIVLWGDGSELREFLYVKDVARIVYELAYNDFDGVLNPVSGISYSFVSVLNLLATITGRIPEIVQRKRTKGKVDNVFSGELFERTFPDFRFTALEEGLRAMVGIDLNKEVP
jgi:UDP-glucose 4-epimerase